MRIPLYQVDAFTSRIGGGNPAAICPLDAWLPDAAMQTLAAENNLSETAFLVGGDGRYEIRWFTPKAEVDLCGHATVAASWVVFHRLEEGRERVEYASRSGPLVVTREGDRIVLDFPASRPSPLDDPEPYSAAMGSAAVEWYEAKRYAMGVYATEAEIRDLAPDMAALCALEHTGFIATAPGDAGDVDFVSRFFAPRYGVPEDPVTGSAHCMLTPYWSKRFEKAELRARQISERGGELACRDDGDRTRIAGQAVLYLEGECEVPES